MPEHIAKTMWTVDNWNRQISGPYPRLGSLNEGIARPFLRYKFGNDASRRVRLFPCQAWCPKDPEDYTEEDVRYYTLFASKGGEISFEDFIEFVDFENKDAILELCARYKQTSATSTSTARGRGCRAWGIR